MPNSSEAQLNEQGGTADLSVESQVESRPIASSTETSNVHTRSGQI